MFGLRYLTGVVTLALDREKCNGCGLCSTVCPHVVFRVADGKSQIVDRDACMECGACARNCPSGAIAVRPGVGCAAAVIAGAAGGSQPKCGCSNNPSCCQ